MTLQQAAYEKMLTMPDDIIQLVINYIDIVNAAQKKAGFAVNDKISDKYAAFLEGEELRRVHPFPKNIDIDKALEEALEEKYGPFN